VKRPNKPIRPLTKNCIQLSSLICLLPIFLVACGDPQPDSGAAAAPTRPNIILIMTDDQGWGDLSLSGNPNLQTPNIDALAKNGASFQSFYVNAVCSPTRAELLTGRYYLRGGVYSTSAGGERLDLDETTIGEVFRAAGYQTACYGKWHNGMQYPYHPNGRGFDDYYGFCSGHWGNYFSPMLERNGQIVTGEGFIIDDLTNKALSFVEEHQNEPFFLYLPFNTPHGPMSVPDKWWQAQAGKSLEAFHYQTEKEDTTFTKAALALCENIDWNVGRITAALDSLELAENTIVLYLTDNGPNSWRWNGGMKGRKGHVDEGGVRSPLLVQWKGHIAAGLEVEQIAGVTDLFPTLTDLAGIAQLKGQKPFDGSSLGPLLLQQGDTVALQERVLVNYWRGNTSLRYQDFRLDRQEGLFDVKKDPAQTQDLSEGYPEVKQKLLEAKAEWEASVLPELPEVDTRPFTIAHPDYPYYQLPARDAVAHGGLKRSNKWPNCSFYTNWTTKADSITWDLQALSEGVYTVTVYYTAAPEAVGSSYSLSFSGEQLGFTVEAAHDPPLRGFEKDRYPRDVSAVKDFLPARVGTIKINKGKGRLTLKASALPAQKGIDFRLLMLEKAS